MSLTQSSGNHFTWVYLVSNWSNCLNWQLIYGVFVSWWEASNIILKPWYKQRLILGSITIKSGSKVKIVLNETIGINFLNMIETIKSSSQIWTKNQFPILNLPNKINFIKDWYYYLLIYWASCYLKQNIYFLFNLSSVGVIILKPLLTTYLIPKFILLIN